MSEKTNEELAAMLDDVARMYTEAAAGPIREAAARLRQQSEEVPETFPKTVWLRENDGVLEFTDEGDPCGFAYSAGQSEDSARFDFLEQLKDGQINYNGVQWVLSIPDQEPPYLWSYPSGKTLRAAIDKARR